MLINPQAKEQRLAETLENITKYKKDQTRQASIKLVTFIVQAAVVATYISVYVILYRQEQDKLTFQKHHAELKEKKLATLQEKLEIKRRGKVNWQIIREIDKLWQLHTYIYRT